MKFPRFPLLLLVLANVALPALPRAVAGQRNIDAPEGKGEFGYTVDVLPNGNIVVTDRYYDEGAVKDVGAVFLYTPAGELISKLTGKSPDDRVGGGGVTVLANGNYVVRSYRWDAGPNAQDAGAVTWCSGVTGLNGVVSSENSLVGSSNGDLLGHSLDVGGGVVVPLPDGDYVVCSPEWRNGTAASAGAVTWGNGKSGTKGVVSASNSLVGSKAGERLGFSLQRLAVTPINSAGDYVVCSPRWANGTAQTAGAVIWCPGDGSRTGTLSTTNALVGETAGCQIGNGGVFPLTNGNYVVCSPAWHTGSLIGLGAVTWCPAGGGLTGAVTEGNSLTGSNESDTVGGRDISGTPVPGFPGPVTALTDGHYTVRTPAWKKGDFYRVGAVTWCDGTVGRSGKITPDNSLTGEREDDAVGNGEIVALPGGHYVVSSFNWSNGDRKAAGAVMRVTGGGPVSGVHTEANSLTGSQAGDAVGSRVTLLTNGHYVVSSPAWHLGAVAGAGAVTWCDGIMGRTGPVTAENSLTGSAQGDNVGGGLNVRFGVTALQNGNYVVASPWWAKGSVLKAGAVTWCPGQGGLTGPVTAANSLTGDSVNDLAGGYNPATADARAVTALDNGNYVVNSPFWDNGALVDAGAVTWCDGTAGRSGSLSATNSLVGGRSQDKVGFGAVKALPGGNYTIFSPNWANPALGAAAGAVTLGDGGNGPTGLITDLNSVPGPVSNGGVDLKFSTGSSGRLLAVGIPRVNRVILFSPDITSRPAITLMRPQDTKLGPQASADFETVSIGGSRAIQFVLKNTGFAPLNLDTAVLNGSAFSLATPPAPDLAPGETTPLIVIFRPSSAGSHTAVLRLEGAETDNSPFEVSLKGTGISGGPALINDLAGPAGSGRFGDTVTLLPNGNLVVTDPYFDLPGPSPVKDAGAVRMYNPGGTLVSTLTGSSANDRVGANGVTVLRNGNFLILSPYWSNGDALTAGAVTWADGLMGVSGKVSADNSLVGSHSGDSVGMRISSPQGPQAGATALENGNYVVCSTFWDNGLLTNVGAVTWGNGATGVKGLVSSANSLTGGSAEDLIGVGGATALKNGNYAVCSPYWKEYRGAVTWGDGTKSTSGIVSSANSLTGSAPYDYVGRYDAYDDTRFSGVFALENGNYVVCSPDSSCDGVELAGVATWCGGAAGRAGVVSSANSLSGSRSADHVGSGGVTVLTNGNYVVSSPLWDNGPAADAGAVTWGSGMSGVGGPVTQDNSLIGTDANDHTGSGGVTALTNGNYVINSPVWSLPGYAWGGVVTWADGAAGIRGLKRAENALIGTGGGISWSGNASVTALANGNYVVCIPSWMEPRGAVTWRPGNAGGTVSVSLQNSLVGPTFTSGYIGLGGGTALTNGNYVFSSPSWTGNYSASPEEGAVTWVNGSAAQTGEVNAGNSLTGSSDRDRVGSGNISTSSFIGAVTALTNGNYLVTSTDWDNGQIADAGAITWGSGVTGVTGQVSAGNSVVGRSAGDRLGSRVKVFSEGHFGVHSPSVHNGAAVQAGVFTLGTGTGPLTGPFSRDNSVIGEAPNGGSYMSAVFRNSDRTFMVARPRDNIITFFHYYGDSGGASVTVTRDGTELANGAATDFGEVETGQSRSVIFTLRNTGGTPLPLSSLTTDSSQFPVSAGPVPATLEAGGTAAFTVTFTPSAAGSSSARLQLSGGAPGTEILTLTLRGTGKAPTTENPFGNSGQAPRIQLLPDGKIQVIFMGIPGKSYLLQSSVDLRVWSEGIAVTAEPDGSILWTDPIKGPSKSFYRLRAPGGGSP